MAHRNDSTVWQWLHTVVSINYATFVVALDGRNDFYNSIENLGQYEVLHSENAQWVDQWLDDNEITCILSDETRTIHEVLDMNK